MRGALTLFAMLVRRPCARDGLLIAVEAIAVNDAPLR